MAAKSYGFTLRTHIPVASASTSAFTLVSFDGTNLPPVGAVVGIVNTKWPAWPGAIGAIAAPATISVRGRVLQKTNGGDHGARIWEKVGAFSVTGGSCALVGVASGNGNASGLVGEANGSTVTFDVSSNIVRCRITPDTTDSYLWMGVFDVEICQFQ